MMHTDPTEPLDMPELARSIHEGPSWRGLLRLGLEAVGRLRRIEALLEQLVERR